VAFTRTGPDVWSPLGRPEYLIQEAYKSRRRLGVESIGLWQLHRIDPKVPRDEQFGAIKTLLDLGVIRNVGLSEVSVPEIEAASRVFKVATVQSRYEVVKRHGVAPSQIALAWVLKRSPVMLPIPGTSKVKHLEGNVAAANIKLSDEDFTALDRQGKQQAIVAAT
jgi:pyridoxine 4-dehydrogenase